MTAPNPPVFSTSPTSPTLRPPPMLPTLPQWAALFGADARGALAEALRRYVQMRRWFRAKARVIRGARVVDLVPLSGASPAAATSVLALLELQYETGGADWYALPLARVAPSALRALVDGAPQALIALLGQGPDAEGLVDGLQTGHAAGDLFGLARTGRAAVGEAGQVRGRAEPAMAELPAAVLTPRFSPGEQTNSTIAFGDRALMKIYRQLTAGPNPELEMGLFLSAQPHPPPTPRVLGALAYEAAGEPPRSLGILHQFFANDGDAWSMTARELRDYFARVAEAPGAALAAPPIGRFGALAETLGRRTGELHLALGRPGIAEADFQPEPLTADDRAAAIARVRAMLDDDLAALGRRRETLADGPRGLVERLLSPQSHERLRIETLLERFGSQPIAAQKTRIHGDLHLGQVLVRGDDFVIIDFEGEPSRRLEERRGKSSPLRDVVGMVRSFGYAPEAVLRESVAADAEAQRTRVACAEAWTRQVSRLYLAGYLATVAGAPFLPPAGPQLSLMLAFHELERVVYEIGYEIDNRPDWIDIPLRGLARLVGDDALGELS
jgi:trehalose synthase-fused probable maltokinase